MHETKYDLIKSLIKANQDKSFAISDFWIQEQGDELPVLHSSRGQEILLIRIGDFQVKDARVTVYLKWYQLPSEA